MSEQHAPPAEQRLAHHGRGGEIYAILLANLALNVLTLGVYHFWAKTRVRRYLWSHTAFAAERFEYTGRGLELLLGYLVAMAVLVPLLGVWQSVLAFLEQAPLVAGVSGVAGFAGLAFLTGMARFSARRYLLSRTRWRGVRFGLSGSAAWHGLLSAGYTLLLVVTLGLAWPLMSNRLTARQINRAWFGDLRFRYDGHGRALFGRFLAAGAMALALLLAAAVVAGLLAWLGGRHRVPGVPPLGAMLPGLAPVAVLLLALPGLWLVWLWYRAAEYRYFIAHTALGTVRFRPGFTPGGYVRLKAANLFLLVLTLGMAYAWVIVRTARFACNHLHLEGALDPEAIGQSVQARPRLGEGLAEVFDLSPL